MAKNDLICLGLIYSAPCHAYAIDEIVKKLQLDEWGNLSRSSIYNTLTKLVKQDCVKITFEKKGNMPERKVYTITEKGKEKLHEEVIKSMDDTGPKENIFYMGLNFYFNIDKDEAKKHLNHRMNGLKKKIARHREDYRDAEEKNLYHIKIQCMAGIKHSEVEIELINNVISIFDEHPDYFTDELQELYKTIIEEKKH